MRWGAETYHALKSVRTWTRWRGRSAGAAAGEAVDAAGGIDPELDGEPEVVLERHHEL